MIRVVIADDMAELAASFAEALTEHGIHVAATATNGAEAVRLARALDPDIVLMDLRMPVMDGIKAARKITAEGLRAKVVMMTAFEDESLIRAATDAGACGYIVKGTLIGDTIAALQAIAQRSPSLPSRP